MAWIVWKNVLRRSNQTDKKHRYRCRKATCDLKAARGLFKGGNVVLRTCEKASAIFKSNCVISLGFWMKLFFIVCYDSVWKR